MAAEPQAWFTLREAAEDIDIESMPPYVKGDLDADLARLSADDLREAIRKELAASITTTIAAAIHEATGRITL